MKILAFGEILWDIFDTKKEIGGASFNFAAHMSKLGADCSIISALGKDALGENALEKVKALSIGTDYIGFLDKPTGICQVTFHENTPQYELVKGVAYDFIPTQNINDPVDAFYFGTLAQRSEVSQATLLTSLETLNTKEVFFDINIRQQYYSKDIIENSLKKTSILKISREEMGVFFQLKITDSDSIEELCKTLSATYPLKLILVTLDKDGAMLFDCLKKEFMYSRKPESKVVSTVGAGDSFSACFLYNYLNSVSLEQSLDRAVTLSDYVVTKLGAIPEYEEELLKKIK